VEHHRAHIYRGVPRGTYRAMGAIMRGIINIVGMMGMKKG